MKPGTLIWESPIQFSQGLIVLANGAHPDDVELGASATIMMLLDKYEAKVFYRVFSYGTPSWYIQGPQQYFTYPVMRNTMPQHRAIEAFKAAVRMGLPIDIEKDEFWRAAFNEYFQVHTDPNFGTTYEIFMESEKWARETREKSGTKRQKSYGSPSAPIFHMFAYEDTMFPNHWREILNSLEEIKTNLRKEQKIILPQLVFHPTPHDIHQDHHELAMANIRAFRQGEMRLGYGLLQYEPGGFTPNLFVDVSGETIWARQLMHQDDKKDLKKYGEIIKEKSLGDATIYLKKGSYAERKVDLIRECFRTQYIPGRFYMVPDRILGIMRANAIHCGYDVEYAEGFEGRISM